jgi:hypothetical protein
MEENDEVRRIIIRKPKTVVQHIGTGLSYVTGAAHTVVKNKIQKVRNLPLWAWIANKIDRWDWENTWGLFLLIAVILLFSLAYHAIADDKYIHCYYVEVSVDKEVPTYYINGYVPWQKDKACFITKSKEEAIQILSHFPQCPSKYAKNPNP